MSSQKKSKKANPANKAYLTEKRWIKNKALKLAKHKKKHPNDLQEVGLIPNYTRVKPLPYSFGATTKQRSRKKLS